MIFLPIYIGYVIGRPRFLVTWLSKLWDLRVTPRRIRLFYVLSFFFVFQIFLTWVRRMKTVDDYKKDIEMYLKSSSHLETIPEYTKDEKLRQIYLYERDIFQYLAYFVFLWIYVKCSNVYRKIYMLEDELKIVEKVERDAVEKQKKVH